MDYGTLSAVAIFVGAAIMVMGGYGDDGRMVGYVLAVSRARKRHDHTHEIFVVE